MAMRFKFFTRIATVALLAVLSIPIQLAAQHTRYKLVKIDTLGGPSSYPSVSRPGYQILANSGIVSMTADISTPDPFAPNCANPDCFVSHTARWEKGVLTDLGTLPGEGFSSGASAINAQGWIAGASGTTDPLTNTPVGRAVLWRDDQIIDLGNFGGPISLAITLNNAGQVVGAAINTTSDPFPLFAPPTQSRAFIWQDGVMRDLGTLGGPDAMALSVNERGLVAGMSYTDPNETVNPTTGMPTVHAFLWDHDKMTDLGTFGGTVSGPGYPGGEGSLLVNNRGQVIGDASFLGDQIFHPFLWDHGRLRDLGTLGGDNGAAVWLTDTGEVLGEADLPGSQTHDAFLWRDGVMSDLGTLGGDSVAFMMNSRGQIVGRSRLFKTPPSSNCPGDGETTECIRHAFLWENGRMHDLNGLVPRNNMVLYEADNINERGEIVAWALPAGCSDRDLCGRIVLLVPCAANNASACENDDVNTTGASQSTTARGTDHLTESTQVRPAPSGILGSWRTQWAQHYLRPALWQPTD
jgi:probable HAF family extracellular repeat protein